jgi:hypothetical protein
LKTIFQFTKNNEALDDIRNLCVAISSIPKNTTNMVVIVENVPKPKFKAT